jgi:uncharacterized protein involved in outer membrane biogenesis
MKRAGKRALIAASALGALIAVALLYLQFSDLGIWVKTIEQKISTSSGYDIAVNGPIDLDIGSVSSATVSAITISSPGAGSDEPFLRIADLHISLSTRSLFGGPVKITNLEMSGADIDMQVSPQGVNNWQPDVVGPDEPDDGDAPHLEQIVLDEIRISYSDQSSPDTATTHRATLNHAVLSVIDERVELLDSRVVLDAGSIDLKGQIEFGDAKKPKVVATLSSPSLEFADPPAEEETEADATDPPRLFSDDLLEESWLGALDLDLGVMLQQLTVGAETVEDLSASVKISDGALSITPFALVKGDGKVMGNAHLAPGDEGFTLTLSVEAQQLRLDTFAAEGQDPNTVPPLDLQVDFTGSGKTMHEIAASSSGNLHGKQYSGQVNMQGTGFLFADIVTSVFRTLNPLAESEPYAQLECSIIDVNIESGVATIDELVAQLDSLVIVGSGNVNLDSEELDLTIRTKTREGLGLSLGGVVNSLLAVGGTINEPALNIDPAGSVTTAGAAVATGGLSVLAKGMWDRLSAEADICSEGAD